MNKRPTIDLATSHRHHYHTALLPESNSTTIGRINKWCHECRQNDCCHCKPLTTTPQKFDYQVKVQTLQREFVHDRIMDELQKLISDGEQMPEDHWEDEGAQWCGEVGGDDYSDGGATDDVACV